MRRRQRWMAVIGLSLMLALSAPSASPGIEAALALAAGPLPAIETTVPRAAGPTLIEIDDQHIVIEWAAPAYRLSEHELEGRTVQQVVVPDCPPAGRPGEPQLPLCTVLLGIPSDATLALHIVEEESVPLPGTFSLPPFPEQVVEEPLPPDGPAGVQPVGKRWIEGPAYAGDELFPLQRARLGETAFLRHQRIVPLSFYPLQYRPRSGELLYRSRLRIEIAFVDAQEPMGYVSEPPAFERLLSQQLLNYSQARNWRRTTTHMPLDLPPAPPEPGWRIPVDQTGVYQLTYERLQQAGLPVDTLDPRTLRLFRYGQEVAIQVQGEEDGRFDPGDLVLFYGQAITGDRYTDTEVYWLTYGGPSGRRVPRREGIPHGSAPVPSFTTTEQIEENRLYFTQMPYRPDHDHWWWNQTYPEGGILAQSYIFPAHSLALELYSVTLRLHLYSWTRDDVVDPDHHIRVYLNDILIGERWWDGRVELTPTLIFSSALLQDSGNAVRVEAPGDTGAFAHYNLYDWVELEQRRLFIAEQDQLNWAGSGGNWEYHLAGFSEAQVFLLDVSDPDSPVEIVSSTIVPAGLSYTLQFEDTVTRTTMYLAVAAGQRLEPESIELATPVNLRDPSNGADYLVVTHGDFYTQALSLAAFRAGQGLRTMAVDVQDVYDLFGYGRRDPEAIHDFLAYTYETWTPLAPGYVILLGDGHWDSKNYKGYGTGNYILPYLAFVDPWIGETAADNRYVCISGEDILPDMHLGRLPANTSAQAQVMVNKIIDYESAPPSGDWYRRTLFVADDADDAGDFAALSDNLIAGFYPVPYEAERVYLGVTHPYEKPSVAARDAIVAAINEGRLLVNYIGHGGSGVWASERLLRNSYLASLSNGPYFPVVLPMTCWEGYYHYPYPNTACLAEHFLRAEGKGWAASWSATGQGVASGHDYLNKGFFQAIFYDDERQLGPATLAGKLNLYATGTWLDLLDTYLLFGDPALEMPLLPAELDLHKAVQPDTPLLPGDPLTFTLVLANAGPATAHHVVLSDVLSPLLISPTVMAEGITLSQRPGPAYAWDVEDIVAGQAGTVTIAAHISPTARPGLLTNQAIVATSASELDLQNNVDMVTLAITVGPPAQITLTAAPSTLPADGNSLSLIQALVLDAAGNPVADGTPVHFVTDAGTFLDGGTFYEGETYLGLCPIFLRAADQVLTATVLVTSGLAANQVAVPFLPMSPYTITVWADPAAIPLTGTARITATVQDVLGHPVANGTPVSWTTSLGVLSPTLAATHGGLATTTLQGDGRHGLATILARSGDAVGVTAVRIGAGAEFTLSLEVTPTSLPADGQSQALVTATLRGDDGGLITGTYWISFSTTLGEIPPQGLMVDGTAVVSLTAGTVPGLALVMALLEGASAWTQVRLVPGGPATLTLTAVPGEVPVDGYDSLLVTLVRDAWGSPVADGTPVFLSTTLGVVTPTLGSTQGGESLAMLTSGPQAGTAAVLATAGPASATVVVRFLALSPATLTLAVDPPVLVADGVSSATLSLWVQDRLGNPVEGGTPVQFLTTLGQVLPGETTTYQGWATATLVAATEVGTATVRALVQDLQAQVTVPFIPGPLATILVTADPVRLVADGVSTATVRVYLWDGQGHTVVDGIPVSLTNSLGDLSPDVAWSQGGRVTATLRSTVTLGTSLMRATSGEVAGSTEVFFVPGPPATVWVTADPFQLLADGVSTATVSAYIEDAYGHPVEVGTPVTFSTSLGTITPEVTLAQGGWATTTLHASSRTGWAYVWAQSGAVQDYTQVQFYLYRYFLHLLYLRWP